MSQDDDVERVARAIYEAGPLIRNYRWRDLSQFTQSSFYAQARAAISAMPQRLSPDLIAQLNKLATYLTAQGEYEAVDLIDTVVARVTAMPGRELLADALEALDEIEDDLGCPPSYYGATSKSGHYCPNCDRSLHSVRERARAAADKIRASLTQEKS